MPKNWLEGFYNPYYELDVGKNAEFTKDYGVVTVG